MNADEVAACFTGSDGNYRFARWGRPIAPIVFGVEDVTLQTVKGAIEALAILAGHQMAETDPELGSNLMFFFFRDWAELLDVPDLDRLIPDLAPLVARLNTAAANQYRIFRFDQTGAIKATFVFLRMDDVLSKLPAEELALAQAAQVMVLWSDRMFAEQSPLVRAPDGTALLRPDVSELIAAAYDRVMPVAAQDQSHALRLAARLP